MLVTKFLYWFFKNLLSLTLPLVVILWSFSLNIPNSTQHSQILKDAGFYQNLNSEIQKLNQDNNFPAKEGLWYTIIASTSPDTISITSLQTLFEKNIALTSSWFDGQSGPWHFYIPTKNIAQSLENNFDIKTVEIAKAKKDDIPSCPDQSLVKYIIDLEKDFCIPDSIANGKGLMSEFVRSNLNFQGKMIQVLFSKDQEVLKKTDFKASEIGIVSESLAVSMNNFRDGFLKTRNTINILLPILLLSLLLVPIFALALNKRPINELKIILRLLGITSLVNTLVLIVTSQVIFLQNLNITGLRSEVIINLFSDVFWKFMVELMTPALWFSAGFIALSFVLYFIERMDLDSFRHFLARSWENFTEKIGLKKILKKDK